MLEKTTEAIETIQTLREQRVKTGTLEDLQLSGEELVNYIRNERRLELTFEGQRWFDLRRYAVCPKWPFQKEIHHPYYVETEIKGARVLRKYDEEPEFYVLFASTRKRNCPKRRNVNPKCNPGTEIGSHVNSKILNI